LLHIIIIVIIKPRIP